jgi:hypothetical protein
VIAVRVLRQGAVVREQVLRDLPVRVGRSPDNDVVLFDPSVSRAHAVIEADAAGDLVVRDLGSRNAVHLGPRAVSEAHGARVVRCLLGRVEIEVERLGADDTLELPPQELAGFEQRRTTADHARYVALGVAAWLATVVGDPDFWSPWQQNRAAVLLWHSLAAAVIFPLAALAVLGLLRLAGRRVRIADTLRALSVLALVFAATKATMAAAYYVLPVGAFATLKDMAGIALTVWAVVHLASLRRPGRSPWFRAAWGTATLLLVVGMQMVGTMTQERMGMPQVDTHVQPPLSSVIGPRGTMGAYLDRLGAASDRAAQRAAEVNAKHSIARQARARVTATASPAAN